MTGLALAARLYVAGVIAAGTALFAFFVPSTTFEQPLLFFALLVLSSVTAALKVRLPLTTGGSTMSVSYAVDFASLLLLGPHETMLVAAGSAFSQCQQNTREHNPLYRTLFSMASLIITVQGAGLAFHALGGTTATVPLAEMARPLVGAATVYFLLNTGLIATAIALSSRESIPETWNNNFLWSAPSYFVGAGTAALASSLVMHLGYWIAPLTFAPLYLTYRTYKVYMGRVEDEQRHVQQTSDLHLATIEALARAIDAKDQMTQMHIRRVQVYATGLARACGLVDHEIQGVKTAALLHDIGKLAVPEHILSKPGPLTQEEFQKIRIHPQVGAEIIAAVPFPYPVAPLIMSHHERWDGKGYPQGLKAEEIPIGARILQVVDCFDALTSDRPYRTAMTDADAMKIVTDRSGTMYDPRVVSALVELQAITSPPAVAPAGPELAAPRLVRTTPAPVRHDEPVDLLAAVADLGAAVALHRSPALVGEAVWNSLRGHLPASAFVLFVCDAHTLVPAYRVGESTVATSTRIPIGERLSGWVAATRRTIVNSDARLDFDSDVREATSLRTALAVPIVRGGETLGVLACYAEGLDAFGDPHQRLAEAAAHVTGQALERAAAPRIAVAV
jgi:putative nucleotidyltransferase with HDIG domain